MSFESLQKEVASWPDAKVRQLQAYLVSLRHRREPGAMEKLALKLDDPDPAHWISLDEVEKRLGLGDA